MARFVPTVQHRGIDHLAYLCLPPHKDGIDLFIVKIYRVPGSSFSHAPLI